MEMNLVVEIAMLSSREASTRCDDSLAICDRCQDPAEIVIAKITIPALEKTISVCGKCLYGLPTGYISE
jgi:hypothetical protein